ncbi:hypothetical protein DCAR_0831804 [Daucus carota subsp. sativus]|uniref:Uncharacterized protein n=1 Tax=Daucus carota subsp. sativus TaxID=79200 RepID=A0A175YME4_DAUCS|nr:PREDICTED: F-box protein FBW2-like [Daucus carota subsp. sativus]WOH12302.1 hypothetical protein DCAR_0831804 [Daucus carota subsp. sativus]
MKDRKWEEMSTDCLVNIFGRLDMKSRLLDIPGVCKTWYQAVHNPLCWQQLDFSDFTIRHYRAELLKIVVKLSQGCVTSLVLSHDSTKKDLIYLSKACPALKTLELIGYYTLPSSKNYPSFEGKWKNLEFISLRVCLCIPELIKHIFIYLPSFTGLSIVGGDVDGDTASMIVSLIPKLKHLTINNADLEKKDLLIILRGCRELVFLDVRDCNGFDEDDEEILQLASAIKTFCCDGSTTEHDSTDGSDLY